MISVRLSSSDYEKLLTLVSKEVNYLTTFSDESSKKELSFFERLKKKLEEHYRVAFNEECYGYDYGDDEDE